VTADPRATRALVKHPARLVAVGVAVVVALVGIVLATQVGGDPRADTRSSPLVGRPVPEFEVETLDGTTITDADLVGKTVVVNFWNTWCLPCEQEHPALVEFYARHASDPDFVLLAIVRDDTARAVRDYQERTDDPWVIALDRAGAAALAFGTRGQPETYTISPDGLVAGAKLGPSSVADLEVMLRAARGTA
jgi:cytochrome c biogenesis protein CcmG/thiol:disulfide interchange protein DsbE